MRPFRPSERPGHAPHGAGPVTRDRAVFARQATCARAARDVRHWAWPGRSLGRKGRMRSTRPRSSHRLGVLASRAASMRAAPTTTEALLWQALRGSRLGVSFRRQLVIGEYIADFAAPSVKLVVEVDGPIHTERTRADARRDRALAHRGYRVVRIPAALVAKDLGAALLLILEALP